MTKYFKFIQFFAVYVLIFLQDHNGRVLCDNRIFLFSDHQHKGNNTFLDISKCSNLPDEMVGKVTSVNTAGLCARLYDGKDCTGESIEVNARSPSHGDLGYWKFNDLMVSAELCREACNVNVTGPAPPMYGLNVSIYDRINYQGATQVLNVQSCTVIPRKFNYRVLSINTTNSKTCFQLYDNVDCNSALGMSFDSIELRQGTPFHNDIRHWHISQIKAISHCSFKCSKNRNSSHATLSSLVQPQHENEVILYDEPKFKGNLLKVIVEDKKCVNLDQFNGWEGAAQSVKVFKNITSCFALYASQNCSGKLNLKLNVTLQDMTARNFSAVTRSILYHAIPCQHFTAVNATASMKSSQVSKAGFRWATVVFTTLGLIVGIFVLLLALVKWWYPNMKVGTMIQIFRRNELGTGYLGAMRL